MFSPISETQARRFAVVFVMGSVVLLASPFAYGYLLWGIERSEPVTYLLPLLVLGAAYCTALLSGSTRQLFVAGLVLRVVAVAAFPLLSDDVYRFLWDGELWSAGLHPLQATPSDLASGAVGLPGTAFAKTHAELLLQMNSAGYYTVYPPLAQLVFAVAAKLTASAFWGSVALKIILLGGELGVYVLLRKLCPWGNGLAASAYWLHPLVLIEVMGNAHLESLALCGLLFALYQLRRASVGLARQGWYHLRDVQRIPTLTVAQQLGQSPRPRIRRPLPPAGYATDYSPRPGPGLPPHVFANVATATTRSIAAPMILAAVGLAAAGLIKLVPLLAAPALGLAVLWRRIGLPVYDRSYYAKLPQALLKQYGARLWGEPYIGGLEVESSKTDDHLVNQDEHDYFEYDPDLDPMHGFGYPEGTYSVVVDIDGRQETRYRTPLSKKQIGSRRLNQGHRSSPAPDEAPNQKLELPHAFVAPPPPEQPREPLPTLAEMKRWDLHPKPVLPPPDYQPPRDPISTLATLQLLYTGTRVALPVVNGRQRWDFTGAVVLASATGTLVLLALLGFVWGVDAAGFGESLDLYFRIFEFNGSLYTLASALGQAYKGFNWIAVVGPGLAVLSTSGIVAITVYKTWRSLDLAETLLWCFGIYLLCATTVHPWYFIYLVGLAALTRYQWPYVLGFTGFLSYVAYATPNVEVPVWALLLEYVPVIAFAMWELRFAHDWRRGGR